MKKQYNWKNKNIKILFIKKKLDKNRLKYNNFKENYKKSLQ